MMARRGNGQGTLFQRRAGGVWLARWYDHSGQRQERATGTTDKRAAQRILSTWVTAATLRREGTIDARVELMTEHARRPIGEHLRDFEASQLAKGSTEKHVALTLSRARKVLEGAKIKTWADASASRAVEYLQELRADRELRDDAGKVTGTHRGISAQTFNFYLQALKQFGRWMLEDRRAAENPFAYLEPLNVKLDRRHDRRAGTVDELRRLLTAAEAGPVVRGMTGSERAVLYRVAVETGLRASELRSLTRASFRLEDDPPTVTVAAAYSKRRREDKLPLRPETADVLRQHLAKLAPAAQAFKVPDSLYTAAMLRVDLAAAGIPYRDDAGRVVDFHALRHTFISNLTNGGVHPKTAQSLARHSTITLTMDRYTHQIAGRDAEALGVLPDLSAQTVETRRATGTDGRARDSSHDSSSAESRQRGANRRNERAAGKHENEQTSTPQKALKTKAKCDAAQRGASYCDDGNGGYEPPVPSAEQRIRRPLRCPVARLAQS